VSTAAKVGDTVWIFDGNRRVYEQGSHGPPIYAKHWIESTIISETRTSLVLDRHAFGRKVDKATGELRGNELGAMRRQVAFSRQAVDDDIWLSENRHRISRDINTCADVVTLREIDALLKSKAVKP
jgi:hypothetical protein